MEKYTLPKKLLFGGESVKAVILHQDKVCSSRKSKWKEELKNISERRKWDFDGATHEGQLAKQSE